MSKNIIIKTTKNLSRHLFSTEELLPIESKQRNPIEFFHCTGVHKSCGCWVDIRNVAPKFNALVCRGCNLIVPIPITIRTWDELETYMKEARK